MIPAPDPAELARREEEWRQIFGPGAGCSEPYYRTKTVNLPYLLAQAEYKPAKHLGSRFRVWLGIKVWRLKRWLGRRGVWIAAVVLLLALAFMAGRVYAAEPHHDGTCFISEGLPSPGCDPSEQLSVREMARAALLVLGVVALWLALGDRVLPPPPQEPRS